MGARIFPGKWVILGDILWSIVKHREYPACRRYSVGDSSDAAFCCQSYSTETVVLTVSVCMPVCLSTCVSLEPRLQTSPIFRARYSLPRFDPSPVMRFRFCGWRHVCTQLATETRVCMGCVGKTTCLNKFFRKSALDRQGGLFIGTKSNISYCKRLVVWLHGFDTVACTPTDPPEAAPNWGRSLMSTVASLLLFAGCYTRGIDAAAGYLSC